MNFNNQVYFDYFESVLINKDVANSSRKTMATNGEEKAKTYILDITGRFWFIRSLTISNHICYEVHSRYHTASGRRHYCRLQILASLFSSLF